MTDLITTDSHGHEWGLIAEPPGEAPWITIYAEHIGTDHRITMRCDPLAPPEAMVTAWDNLRQMMDAYTASAVPS